MVEDSDGRIANCKRSVRLDRSHTPRLIHNGNDKKQNSEFLLACISASRSYGTLLLVTHTTGKKTGGKTQTEGKSEGLLI